MNNYFDTNEKKDCNGCGVCALKCPKNAIEMVEDEEGFLYPKINKEKCINCGLCKRICSNNINELNTNTKTKTYIAINNNKDELMHSSSGGMFSLLARYVIEKGGVVFGVEYDSNLNAIHGYCEEYKDIKRFQGSKYVRSDLNNSYNKVEKFLKENRYVLFTGTPCQCQGLRKFLQKDYERLLTCDIICHANPSAKIFNMYKKNIELKYSSKVKDIIFRDKNTGWRCQTPTIKLENGKIIQDTAYLYAFLNELINRPSCYNCHFCTTKRFSDFTIGDMWGIDILDEELKENDTGISLLSVNTERGLSVFKKIKELMYYKEIDTEIAFSYNHNHNIIPNKNRQLFFSKVKNEIIDENNIINFLKKYTKKNIVVRIINRIKYIYKKVTKKQ